jgi:NitT/TauT family transport system substrate-binding protein
MSEPFGRRALLGGIAGAVAMAGAGVAIAKRARAAGPAPFRIGVMANLTHAPLLAGIASGRIARALTPIPIELRLFRAGPRVTEALLGDAIDAGTAGPAPVVIHHARHARGANGGLRILAGCCSGGASLVVTAASSIRSASDLRGKRLAVTQLGTTQDVALRSYLREAGLRDSAAGGEVDILGIAGATILDQMKRGALHGAWLPEPWATRIVDELSAIRFVDERDLWPNKRFATAVLASRAETAGTETTGRLVRALEEEVARAIAEPKATLRDAHTELKKHVGNPGAYRIFEKAAAFVDFTSDPLRTSVERFGEAAAALSLCPPNPTAYLFG